MLTHRRGGIHGYNAHASAASLERHLFGHEFGTLVVTDHVGEGNWRIFIGRMAVAGEPDRRHARGIHHTANAVLARRFQNCPRAFDVGAIHFCGILHPEPVIGGDVKYDFAAGHGFFQRRGVSKIAPSSFAGEALQVLEVAGGTDQKAETGALLSENASYVGT